MKYPTQSPLRFATIADKPVQADFDAGALSSDGGVLWLRTLETQLGVLRKLSKSIVDRRHPSYVKHSYDTLIRQRVFQIACGYEDANDCNTLRHDPLFKAACDRLPLSGQPLGSQSTMTRLETTVTRSDLYRMTRTLVEVFLDSYETPPSALLLDIDDTNDPTHGDQELTCFNGHYGEYCYEPLHIYEGQSGKLITTLLRPGYRPSGKELVAILNRLVDQIRQRWPKVQLFLRGDSHFSTPEVHDFCDQQADLFYVLGQGGNVLLKSKASRLLAQAQTFYRLQTNRRPDANRSLKVRLFTEFSYQAKSWSKPRRIICKAEVSDRGPNIRFVVTNLKHPRSQQLYDLMYCGRGRMENFIKNHKTFLHSDRLSCHTFLANSFRLLLHSAAYILLQTLAETGLAGTQWAKAQFNILQNRLLKVAVKVHEGAMQVRLSFPTSFPLQSVYRHLMANLARAAP